MAVWGRWNNLNSPLQMWAWTGWPTGLGEQLGGTSSWKVGAEKPPDKPVLEALNLSAKTGLRLSGVAQAFRVIRDEQEGPYRAQTGARTDPEEGSSPSRNMLACGASGLSAYQLNVNREARAAMEGKKKRLQFVESKLH